MMRTNRSATVTRKTGETDITITLTLDGNQDINIDTGIGFLDHMLHLLAKHGRFGLAVKAVGDTYVDAHHTVEDIALTLGQALTQALGDKAGIERYGDAWVPMDEALTQVVIDLSGRPYLVFNGEFTTPVLGGNFETELVEDFFQALAVSSAMNLHVRNEYGRNTHHIIESMFKATGRALRKAVTINPDIQGVNSTKGMI
ncbi:imidazoleglycerol-phosphate dehydratase [Veillonella atypica ACS-134-V-Col7a]|uniref:Imidazoleglycerol-phosphate dehydratase n=1 Tax=Veillonella atypica ACS-134-V-Col7a TaxID=866778 RepID=E1LDI1_9FIRM|nr:imidazoleglycerol-phosphate dehydratase HisB [Veillonella atypica]EFL57372.1 imidazoleglycerol-phosphate dehydratase [Veillonella atypica ACS-134-V-Col7a]